jgi:acyl-homoserine lactone acylase PvdQ
MRSFLCLITLSLAVAVGAQPSFMSILPPGQDGFVPSTGGGAGPHAGDQLAMYDSLVRDVPGITNADLLRYFKDATIAAPAAPESTLTPRPGVTITRDGFGVPHVAGETRADVFFGAGYATARDRLFFADILRHMGRGRLSEFVGGVLGLSGTIGFDRTYHRVAGHSEAELQAIVDDGVMRNPDFGPIVLADSQAFTDGMNAYIAEARMDPAKLPAEYQLFGLPLDDWQLRDSASSAIAFCTVIGFCNGGGSEHRNVQLFQALVSRFGGNVGERFYDDLRAGEDRSAPVSTRKRFPYMDRTNVDPTAVAFFDEGSFTSYEPIETAAVSVASSALLPFPRGMSNWLAITGKHAEGGRPIMVGGPQTGYFAPQPLIELALTGGGVDVSGMTLAGVPYVVIGHTPDYAWTATAGGSDLVDLYVERLCTPEGGAENDGTLFEGACVPMVHRTDTWMVGDTQVTANIWRTVHGPVMGTATVDGVPVVLARKRTSYALEIDAGAAYVQLNDNLVQTAAQFREVMGRNNASLNWVYVNREEIAYFHSGKFPRRAAGVDPDFPTWGTGEWEWQGFLTATEQPFEIDPKQGFMTSWNNKPARGWRAADGTHDYTSVYRSLLLDARLRPLVKGKRRATLAEAVEAMALAATTDLRGQEILPDVLGIVSKAKDLRPYVDVLRAWLANGAHRIDRDEDGRYDDEAAVALMDAWWESLIRAMFDPQLDGLYGTVGVGFHDAPSSHGGSAFQGGYYGTVKKALRQARGRKVKGKYKVLRCGGGKRKACWSAVQASLRDTVASLTTRFGSDDPATWTVEPTDDEIRFSIGGLATSPPIPWQNRPTFQQAVQIRE